MHIIKHLSLHKIATKYAMKNQINKTHTTQPQPKTPATNKFTISVLKKKTKNQQINDEIINHGAETIRKTFALKISCFYFVKINFHIVSLILKRMTGVKMLKMKNETMKKKR